MLNRVLSKQKSPLSDTSQGKHYVLNYANCMGNFENSITPIYNTPLIEELTNRGVRRIHLLTEVDANTSNYTPLHHPILFSHFIKLLSNNGIEVSRVLTPLDIKFIEAGYESFQPGDAYELFIKPFEKAILEADPDIFSKCKDFFQLRGKYEALQYLKDTKLIDGNILLSQLKKILDTLGENTELQTQFYQDLCGSEKSNIDYDFLCHDLSNLCTYYIHKDLDTVQTFDQLVLEAEKNQIMKLADWPEKEFEKINIFFNELIKYRNHLLHANLTIKLGLQNTIIEQNWYILEKENKRNIISKDKKEETKEAPKEKGKEKEKSDGDEKQNPAQTENREMNPEKHHWKAEVYNKYFSGLCPEEMVIAIDDSQDDLNSLQEAHVSASYRHSLETSLPPICRSFTSTIGPASFNAFLTGCDLKKHLIHHNMNETARIVYINYFNKKGSESIKNKNYIDAMNYFKITFLFCERYPNKKKEKVHQKVLVKQYLFARDRVIKNSESASESKQLLTNLTTMCGFELELKLLDLNILAHQTRNPSLYHPTSKLFHFNFSKQKEKLTKEEIDAISSFAEETSEEISRLEKTYKREDACTIFINDLKKQIPPSSYLETLNEAIGDIKEETVLEDESDRISLSSIL